MSAPLPQTLADAWIDSSVRDAHPDYVAILIAASGLAPGETSQHSEALLREAEAAAGRLLDGRAPHDLPEVLVWREAFQSFGVKPREARPSVEALLRRVPAGLPRIDRLTDVYNAVSVLHLVPLGGEALTGYVGPARLVTAVGDEPFDTVADGEATVHTAVAGEIVWRDDVGVTCRRWNWRQCVRTRFSTTTTEALFIVDGLGAVARDRAERAAAALVELLAVDSPAATFTTRTLTGEGH
jgi:DNA/RNA-binding domain of Phe-tRNA-synthetase-like protein